MKKIFARNYKKNPARLAIDLIVLACVILLGVSLYLWWTRIFMNPERTLNDTIAKNLTTRSITKSVNQSGATGGINQVTYLTFFPSSVGSQTNTTLVQGIGSNATSVSTQTIGTSLEDFVRYTGVKIGNTGQGADRLKPILGKWAERHQDASKGQQVSFLNESLFGVMPFGYFNDSQKSQLIDLINQKNIYKYTDAKRMMQNHRPVYVYDMSINPANLVSVIQEYIKFSGGDPSQLDPVQYQGLGDVKIKLTLDILSRQVVEVQYSTGRTETYSGQNLYHPLQLPSETIPVEELQQRLQGISA